MSSALFNDLETVNGTIGYMGNALPSSLRNGLKKGYRGISTSLDKIQDINSGANASGEIRDALTKYFETIKQGHRKQRTNWKSVKYACSALEGINSSTTLLVVAEAKRK